MFIIAIRHQLAAQESQVSSPTASISCKGKVQLYKAVRSEGCWKLSSGHSHKTKLECGCHGTDAKGM